MSTDNFATTYLLNYKTARTALIKARNRLSSIADNAELPEYEQALAAAGEIDAQTAIGIMDSELHAFMANYSSANPPSQEVINKSSALSAKLAKDISTTNQTNAIIGIINDFLVAWISISPVNPSPDKNNQAQNKTPAKPKVNSVTELENLQTKSLLVVNWLRSNYPLQ